MRSSLKLVHSRLFWILPLFLLCALPAQPLRAHDTDLPEWVRTSNACILDVFAREKGVEVWVDFRRPDALAVLGMKEWDPAFVPSAMTKRIQKALSLNGIFPHRVEFRTDSKMYERWSAVWPGPWPETFDLKVGLFDHLPGSGWCQVFVVPVAGDEPEQSFFFKGDQEFHWPRAITMPGMTWGRFFHLGYVHILPLGLDHILFILCLCLAAPKPWPLLGLVTGFTLAHTLTLGLAAKGILWLSPSIVEPLIAVSIVWAALENTRKGRPPTWRWGVVFGFGLLHGLGFAGVLLDSGLPAGAFLSSLLAFNLGVEAGQLTVVAAGGTLVFWLQKKSWYRKRVLVPLSWSIAGVGGVWVLQRVWGSFS